MFRPASGEEEKGPDAMHPVKAARVAARGKGDNEKSRIRRPLSDLRRYSEGLTNRYPGAGLRSGSVCRWLPQ